MRVGVHIGRFTRQTRRPDVEVASHANRKIIRANCCPERGRERVQDSVAGQMAQRVVDVLEAVEVDLHQDARSHVLVATLCALEEL